MAFHGLPTGGDDSLDQGVLIRGYQSDVATGILNAADDAVSGPLGGVFGVPRIGAHKHHDLAGLWGFPIAIGQLVHEDPVWLTTCTAMQRGFHGLRRNQVHATHERVEGSEQQECHHDDDGHLHPPRVGFLLCLLLLHLRGDGSSGAFPLCIALLSGVRNFFAMTIHKESAYQWSRWG